MDGEHRLEIGLLIISGLSLFYMPYANGQVLGRNYGRSIVISQQGIAATSQVLASQTGAQILARGGSAVDAAIAANAVLGVTEPMMTGLGGDLFVMYWDAKTGKLTGLNSSGPAPQALSPAFLAKHGIKSMPSGRHSYRHGSGRRAGLVSDASALRETSLEGPVSRCDRLCRAGISGLRRRARESGLLRISFRRWRPMPSPSACFCQAAKPPRTGRTVQESRHGARVPFDRRTGAGCVL